VKAGDVVAVCRKEQAVALAQLELEQARDEAAAVAFRQGFAAGRTQAMAQGAGAELRAAEALEALVAAATHRHAEEVSATSRAVLAAALDVAEWILRHELPADSRSLLTRLVRPWAARRRGVEVVVDPALAPGDATFDTDAGSVEVSVAAALRIAAETLGIDPARGVQ